MNLIEFINFFIKTILNVFLKMNFCILRRNRVEKNSTKVDFSGLVKDVNLTTIFFS